MTVRCSAGAEKPKRTLSRKAAARGTRRTLQSACGLQQTLLNQAFKMIPDVIGMSWAAEMEAQLKVEELGGIGKVGAGDEQLLICHHRLDMTDSLLSFEG